MRATAVDIPLEPANTPPAAAQCPLQPACAEMALDAEDLALELHECIVWSSGTSFSHQLPDAFISTAGTC